MARSSAACAAIMASAGSTIFGNLPIIFAVGVAIGMAKAERESLSPP